MLVYTKEAPNGAILNGYERKAVIDVGRRLVTVGTNDPVQVHGRFTWETLLGTARNVAEGLPGRELNQRARELGCRRIRPVSRVVEHLNALLGREGKVIVSKPVGNEIYYAWGIPVTIVGKEDPTKFWRCLEDCESNFNFTRVPRPIDIVTIEAGVQVSGRSVSLTGMQRELGINIPNSGGHYIPSGSLAWLMYGEQEESRKLVALVNKTNKILASQDADARIAYMRCLTTGRAVVGYLWTSR